MTERVTAVDPTTLIEAIARTIVAGKFGGVPVVDRHDRVLGFVYEKDLMTALLQKDAPSLTAADVMGPAPTIIDEFETTDDVMRLIKNSTVDHVLVAREGRLVGIITPLDVIRFFVDHVLPPVPEAG